MTVNNISTGATISQNIVDGLIRWLKISEKSFCSDEISKLREKPT